MTHLQSILLFKDSSGAGKLKGDRVGVPWLRERSNSDDSNKADAGVQNRTRRFLDGVQEGRNAHHQKRKSLP